MILAFKAKEAERKMREAATRHDYEAAIPLRDEWKRLTAELLKAEQEAAALVVERKVIDMRTRKPPEEEPDRSDYTVIDLVTPDAVEDAEEAFEPLEEETSLLAHITDEVKAGRMSGLVIFAGHREEDGDISVVSSFNTSPAWDEMQKFIGAFEECKHDLLAVSGDIYDDDQE